MSDGRPKRLNIPDRIKRLVVQRQNGLCTCGCGRAVEWKRHVKTTRFDHTPAIFLRPINAAGDDYEPPQLDSDYIVARCLESDERRRSGGKARATTAGTDVNAMAKLRARDRAAKPKPAWQNRSFGKRPPGAGNGFPPKGSTPMRRR